MCSPLAGFLTPSLPIGNGLSAEACFGEVIRQELGLSLDEIGEPLLQSTRDALVVVLAVRAD
jgi:hypothetical protein